MLHMVCKTWGLLDRCCMLTRYCSCTL